MAQNFLTQVVNPVGGLDFDQDLSRVAPIDYTHAINITHYTNDGQTSLAVQNVLGNNLEFTIDGITEASYKTYRIGGYGGSPATAGTSRALKFYWTDGSVMATASFSEGATFAATRANMVAAITTALAGATKANTTPVAIPQTVSFSGTDDQSLDVTITTVLGYEYTVLENTSFYPLPFPPALSILVLSEAIDTSLAGNANVIGSYDILGDLFIWSTTQDNLPSQGVSINTASFTAPIVIDTGFVPHGLITGEQITISGNTVNTAANGTWIVNVLNTTQFELENSTALGLAPGTVNLSNGIITTNPFGVGEIGVATYNANTDVTTYTRLIQSKQLNFNIQKQIDTYIEKDNIRVSIYWTDDYNPPRVMYYYGPYPYVVDGLLTVYNIDGRYDLDTINEEGRLIFASTKAQLTFTNQLQAGGQVKSGNWRYTIRLLTESFTGTNWLDLGNPVNVFTASTNGDPTLITGDDAGVITPKINEFEVTGLTPGLFKYVELAGVNYVGGASVGYIIKRVPISATISSITIQHTGTETGTISLDLGTLNQESFGVETAKNIRALDNRLILSNLTAASMDDDFSVWSQTFNYAINQTTIFSVGDSEDPDYSVAEYAQPLNVNTKMGLMHNETYRFGAKYRMKKTGQWTQAFHVADIIINCNPVGGRRVGTLANYNLTTIEPVETIPGDVNVVYVRFSNIDPDFSIGGTPARDLIDAVSFERVEVTNANRTILASGIVVIGTSGFYINPIAQYIMTPTPATPVIGEYPGISGAGDGTFPVYNGGMTEERQFMAFYSPDIQFGNTSIGFVAEDKLICFGNPRVTNRTIDPNNPPYVSQLIQYDGYTNRIVTPIDNATGLYSVDDVVEIAAGGNSPIGTGAPQRFFSKHLDIFFGVPEWYVISSNVIATATGELVQNISGNLDYGIYVAQYYRALTNQYGDVSLSNYVPCGHILDIDATTTALTTTDVFGGDIFTQKTFYKYRFAASATANTDGFGGGIGFYSQNRVNSQMNRRYGNLYQNWDYPRGITMNNWLELINQQIDSVHYNEGYTIRNGINSDTTFNVDIPTITDMPTRIIYSDLKPQNSLTDNYRVFLPLNFRDLDLGFGEIVHQEIVNGELMTWQPRKIEKQFFNTTAQLQTSTGSNIIIGDGAVLSRKGVTITTIGCNNKWSIIKGKSAGGNDVMYWIDTELKADMRLGYDGTISLSDARNAESFFANNLTWVDGKDTPAAGEGICGVWDDRKKEVKWSVRGKRVLAAYSELSTYTTDDAVSYAPDFLLQVADASNTSPIVISPFPAVHGLATGQTVTVYSVAGNTAANGVWVITVLTPTTFSLDGSVGNGTYTGGGLIDGFSTFEHTGEIFIANQAVAAGESPLTNPEKWTLVPHTNIRYYNEYNITFNEKKNKFSTFYSWLPKIFLKWKNTFFTPAPVGDTGNVYLDNKGDFCKWYMSNNGGQVVDGSITMVFNSDPDLIKRYLALLFSTEITPKRIEITTKGQQSFLVDTDFELLIDQYQAAIKNDSTVTAENPTGSNEADSSQLWGQYTTIKMFFEAGVYQKVVNLVTKFNPVSRTYKR